MLQGLLVFYRSGVMQDVFSQICSGCFRKYDIEHMLHQKNISFLKFVDFQRFLFSECLFFKKAVHFQKKIALLSPEDGYKCNVTRLSIDTDLLNDHGLRSSSDDFLAPRVDFTLSAGLFPSSEAPESLCQCVSLCSVVPAKSRARVL